MRDHGSNGDRHCSPFLFLKGWVAEKEAGLKNLSQTGKPRSTPFPQGGCHIGNSRKKEREEKK
jgi:hypothetical protein